MAPYSQAAPALVIAQNSTGRESETGWSVGHMLSYAENGRVVEMLKQMNFQSCYYHLYGGSCQGSL